MQSKPRTVGWKGREHDKKQTVTIKAVGKEAR